MDKTEVGAIIRSWRLAQGLTLREAASRCGISYQMLQQIETGTSNTTIDRVNQIATGLGFDFLASAVPAKTSLAEGHKAIAQRFAAVLPNLDDDDLAPLLAMIAVWERRGPTR